MSGSSQLKLALSCHRPGHILMSLSGGATHCNTARVRGRGLEKHKEAKILVKRVLRAEYFMLKLLQVLSISHRILTTP